MKFVIVNVLGYHLDGRAPSIKHPIYMLRQSPSFDGLKINFNGSPIQQDGMSRVCFITRD